MPPALIRLFLLLAGCCASVFAQPATAIAESEALNLPTAQRLSAVQAAAQREGWPPQREKLLAAAFLAYEREKFGPADAWLYVHRWAALLGKTEAEFVPRWAEAVQAARVGHSNMATQYETRPRPLATGLSAEFVSWAIGNPAFSGEFFNLLAPVDFVPRVFEILGDLYRREPSKFKTYASLALAIALVYDVPPPPIWPHGQVSAAALPRKFPEPAAAFAWWTKQDQIGRTYHKLARLGADELKFVVDTPAPFAELEWAQGVSDYPLSHLDRAYTMVRYRKERVANDTPMWPGRTYALKDILGVGGICSDQAYFATQVGKARGVPTILIYGAGNDGRHAWFGFLDGNQKWHLDAGRYAEQRFVTGFARDPQTWREFSDHELQFLSERFRDLPSFRQSRVHERFAKQYLAAGRAPQAAVAARKAVNFERRNQEGWETLEAAARQEGRDAKVIENLLREAALAFRLYPDLEAVYVNRVAESLRARGEKSAADAEVARIASKHRNGRSDLTVQQARDSVGRAISTQPLAAQIQAYNSAVDKYAGSGGIGFFDQVVTPFVQHLIQLDQRAEAGRALDRARRALKIEPGSQLHSEAEKLQQQIRGK